MVCQAWSDVVMNRVAVLCHTVRDFEMFMRKEYSNVPHLRKIRNNRYTIGGTTDFIAVTGIENLRGFQPDGIVEIWGWELHSQWQDFYAIKHYIKSRLSDIPYVYKDW